MSTPADHHPALGGKTLADWLDGEIPDRTPAGPRHARRGHARPRWWRSLLDRATGWWQSQRGLKARWDARNRAYDAGTERLFGALHAEQEATLVAELAAVVHDAELTAGPEDPCDVLTPEDEADAWVGDLGPAETAGAERAATRDTAYPDWQTGQFAIVDAEMGGGQ